MTSFTEGSEALTQLPRLAVDVQFLEVLKARLDGQCDLVPDLAVVANPACDTVGTW